MLYCIKRVSRYNSRLSSSVNDIYVMCFIITGNNEIRTIIFSERTNGTEWYKVSNECSRSVKHIHVQALLK